ncbi:MAG: TraR/DksA family transcriptional regulator [Chlamydiales bacterium]
MPLKKKEIEEFKKRLEEMRDRITKHFKDSSAEVKKPDEATGYSQHQADQGTDDFDHTIGLELTSQEYELLKQIDRALEKIDEDTYGICDISGKEIPIKRLDAIPYATMTVEAQEKYEQGKYS